MLRAGIGDIHLSGYVSDTLEEDGLNRRLSKIIRSLKQIGDYCRNHNIKYFELWGDIINDKNIIFSVAQEAFKKFIVEYSDIHFIMISGNHDMSSSGDTQVSAISVFDGYPNVTVVNDIHTDGNRTYLAFSNTIFDNLKKLDPSDILISHFGVNEGMLQSGMSVSTEVTMKDLKKFKLVLLGHYHKPQNINNESTRLYYSGNIAHLNWNDKNEQKRFIVYDDESLEVQSIPLTGFTEYKEYVINNKEEALSVLEEAERSKNNGHYVRVKKMCHDVIDHPSDILIIEKEKEVDITNRGIDFSQNNDTKLRNYLTIKEIDNQVHDEYINVLHDCEII